MPNPTVTVVKHPERFVQSFWSTPDPALQMTRPPAQYTEPLYRDRWASDGPYQGVVTPPFDFDLEPPLPVPSIMEPPPPFTDEQYVAPADLLGLGITEEPDRLIQALGVAAVGYAAYHGYRRNRTVGWAVGWGVAAALFPVITTAIALAQESMD